MNSHSSGIEGLIKTLIELESELDFVKADAERAKRELIALARDEASKLKVAMVQEANKKMEDELRRVVQQKEKEAEGMVAKSEENEYKLAKKIETRFERAVETVSKVLLGE